MELEYHIDIPKTLTPCRFIEDELTFSINWMKSRLPSAVYFILHLYDSSKTEISTYTSDRWIVDHTYSHYHHTFQLNQDEVDDTSFYQIELVAVNINSENPLSFKEIMLQQTPYDGYYHKPNEVLDSKEIKFNKSRYANLYMENGDYLQVIRPKADNIFTDKLVGSACTVLAPHLVDETDLDNPINLFLEFLNQTEQRIDVLR